MPGTGAAILRDWRKMTTRVQSIHHAASAHRWWLCSILLVWLACQGCYAGAATGPSDRAYEPGWQKYVAADYAAAGKLWSAAADDALGHGRTAASLQHAAFAHVLATIAFEQDENAEAYASWANAVRFYLEAGTSWEAAKAQMRKRVNRDAQATMLVDGAAPRIALVDQIAIELEQTIQLLSYGGPKTGLAAGKAVGPPVSVSLQYFPGSTADAEATGESATESNDPGPGAESIRDEAEAATRAGTRELTAPPSAAQAAPGEEENENRNENEGQEDVAQIAAPPHRVLDRVLKPRSDAPPFGPADLAIAQRAWNFVVANRQAQTGLVNGKDGYPFVTVADIAHALAASVAAEKLQLTDLDAFLAGTRQLLATVDQLPLYANELFNREYSAQSGRMVDLTGQVSTVGSGWSVVDIARLLIWLKIVAVNYPDLAGGAGSIVEKLNFSRMVAGGQLTSALVTEAGEDLVHDVRLGDEQYTAVALSLWGLELVHALDYEPVQFIQAEGTTLAVDRRARNKVSPDIFPTAVIELGGIDGCFERVGRALLHAQLERTRRAHLPTMLANERLDRPPWFVYSSVFADGETWSTTTYSGAMRPELRTFSTKAAFLWTAVVPDPELKKLRIVAESLKATPHGYFAGRFEDGSTNRALTLATNAAILEAMLYTKQERRPLLRFDNPVASQCPFTE
jgi:Protein of unknown function (DUF3131)